MMAANQDTTRLLIADGVGIGSLLRKGAFALRFSDYRPLISGNLRSSSKILYIRDVRERVKTLATALTFAGEALGE